MVSSSCNSQQNIYFSGHHIIGMLPNIMSTRIPTHYIINVDQCRCWAPKLYLAPDAYDSVWSSLRHQQLLLKSVHIVHPCHFHWYSANLYSITVPDLIWPRPAIATCVALLFFSKFPSMWRNPYTLSSAISPLCSKRSFTILITLYTRKQNQIENWSNRIQVS